mgnify:CR=1 FL=1
MSSLSDAKTLGGIGAILLLVGFPIPYIGFAVSIGGLVLEFIAVKKIADAVKDKSIFSNFLLNFIFGLIAISSLIIIMVATIGSIGGFSFFTTLEGMNTSNPAEIFSYLQPFLLGCIIAFIIMWILSIIGAIYLKKSYDAIADHTKVDSFKTTGLLYVIGTATFIILIGFLVLFIARIFEIISYFSLPDTIEQESKENAYSPNNQSTNFE